MANTWKPVHDAADAQRERMRRGLLKSFLVGIKSLSSSALEIALRKKDKAAVIELTGQAIQVINQQLRRRLPEVLLDTLSAGARSADSVRFRAARRRVVKFKFDVANPAAKQFAEERSAELVRDITGATRLAIREIMAEAFEEGLAPKETAELLRKVVGLDARRAKAVTRIAKEQGQRKAKMYADLQIRKRALTIARTETIRASSEGQRQLWDQKISAGLLSPTAEREWLYVGDKRTCPICEDLNGERAPVRGVFKGGLSGPPAHPLCRCAQVLVPASGRARAASAGNVRLSNGRATVAHRPGAGRDKVAA